MVKERLEVRWLDSFIVLGATDTIDTFDAALEDATAEFLVVRRAGPVSDTPEFFPYWLSGLKGMRNLLSGPSVEKALHLSAQEPAITAYSRSAAMRGLKEDTTLWRAVILDRTNAPVEIGLIGGDVQFLPQGSAQFGEGGRSAEEQLRERLPAAPTSAYPGCDVLIASEPGRRPELRTANGGPRHTAPHEAGPTRRAVRGRAMKSARVRPLRKVRGGARGIRKNGGTVRVASRLAGQRVGARRTEKPSLRDESVAGGGRRQARGRKRNGGGGHRVRKSAKSLAGRAVRPTSVPRPGRSPKTRAADPPRSAYARIDAPDGVLVGDEFTLRVGLAEEAQVGVSGAELERPGWSVGPYTLQVQVSADGFGLRDGDTWRHQLRVTVKKPYPTFDLLLKVLPQEEPFRLRAIDVKYAIQGQPIGFATRMIAVAISPGSLPTKKLRQTASAGSLELPHEIPPADLTATIRVVPGQPGTLGWTFDVGMGIKAKPPDPTVYTDIGRTPRKFIDRLSAQMGSFESKPGLFDTLSSSGDDIANQIPHEFWTLLRRVAMELKSKRRPTVLILTQEPYVPWELATFSGPLLDPSAPRFLAAQVPIGRWMIGSGSKPRPPAPPPHQVTARSMAVIHGDYRRTADLAPLTAATEEADALIKRWKAQSIDAKVKGVLTKVVKPGADVLHFTCHGEFDPKGKVDGLIMLDGYLGPEQVRKLPLKKRPFVFLNACQVGRDRETLGDYAGLAQAFLVAGASAVIAPLWSVDEDVSREMAVRFYRRVFAKDSDSPAEVMRYERRHFVKSTTPKREPTSASWMAFLLFGHPAVRLVRR